MASDDIQPLTAPLLEELETDTTGDVQSFEDAVSDPISATPATPSIPVSSQPIQRGPIIETDLYEEEVEQHDSVEEPLTALPDVVFDDDESSHQVPAPDPAETFAPAAVTATAAASAKPTGQRTKASAVSRPASPYASSPNAETGDVRSFGDDNDGSRLLATDGLVKVYDGRAVVNGVDINVRPQEIVGLLGPNGAGKTTTFYMIVGLVPPNGGRVIFNGNEVTEQPMFKRARLGMGYLPQEESIFRKLTVEQNIMAVMETLNISRSERRDRCQNLMKRFGITHIAKNIALTCSGGEKRRLTIARSLVSEPKLLMLDEPFSGVDPIAVGEIQDIVVDLREQGLAILITDHNVRETLDIVDRAYLISEGKVAREGSRDFLINDPISRELYLGDRFSM